MVIYKNRNWPHFTWDAGLLIGLLSQIRNLQGRLIGKMEAIGFSLREEAMLKTLTSDVIKSTLIEGENLDPDQVRSSIARRLGMDVAGLVDSDRTVEGVVDMMLDATQNYSKSLNRQRLFGWHSALFQSGRSGMYKITVGGWRKDETGPMQVVSGPMGKERVHFTAPPATTLDAEMNRFLDWFNRQDHLEPVIKSGLAHLWFITIHPFDDGNGRIARTIGDMLLARADQTNQRFYSVSSHIEQKKNEYYTILEQSQKGSLDVTNWLQWYLECLMEALIQTETSLAKVLAKARFWEKHATTIFNKRQQQIINKLLDNFFGKLTTSKWAKMAKCSHDTALRDINDLISKEVLVKTIGGGRSSSYEINFTGGK
jgi:Fic family protein